MSAVPIQLKGLTDREACMDTIYRLVQGLDDPSEELLQSAFTEDVVFDRTPANAIGLEFDTIATRDKIVPELFNNIGKPMDTLHQVTNIRVDVDGDKAHLTCSVLAQHFRAGEGHEPHKQDQLFMGNKLVGDLVRAEAGLWRIQKLVLYNQWTTGTLDVFKH
ncbi:hypothetical protein NA57DRAFT_73593 [Rhizodiscina lignyota]|uniref:SnoaL-like domain-containing protein n=1 Tax=Rhizodiscina lignyota TaxID=1504668 RepID=A0A9P4ME08_9PEZI|nr:hypothetical protein NA57DRAFT_73593 [Rhizodiscina lignyota]